MLRVEGVSKRFTTRGGPVDALKDVDLKVATGSFTAVLGASGSGKTTLLRVIAGFERPDAGIVELDGTLITGRGVLVQPEHRNVGIVAQGGALFPHLNVHDNIAYGLRVARTTGRWRQRFSRPDARVEQLLDLVGLSGYGTRSPHELSGGQQQRVALARALAPGPALLLMDEPFSALDAGLRSQVREEVRDLLNGLGTTVVLVTHDQNEALSMADHVVIMRDGQVVQSGSPDELYRRPVDLKTAEFLGTAVVLPARVLVAAGSVGTHVDTMLGQAEVDESTPLPVERTAVLGAIAQGADHPPSVIIRPEQIEFAPAGVPGTVASTNYFGHDGTARVTLDNGPEIVVRTSGEQLPEPGSRVCVALREKSRLRLI